MILLIYDLQTSFQLIIEDFLSFTEDIPFSRQHYWGDA